MWAPNIHDIVVIVVYGFLLSRKREEKKVYYSLTVAVHSRGISQTWYGYYGFGSRI